MGKFYGNGVLKKSGTEIKKNVKLDFCTIKFYQKKIKFYQAVHNR